MRDITRHCNPVGMAGLGLVMAVAGLAAGVAGAIAFGSKTAAAQAAADAVVFALKLVIGKDIAVPPAYGVLIGVQGSIDCRHWSEPPSSPLSAAETRTRAARHENLTLLLD